MCVGGWGAFAEKVVAGAGIGRRGYLCLFKRYRLQSPSRYLIIRRLTVGYSRISERDVEVCESIP